MMRRKFTSAWLERRLRNRYVVQNLRYALPFGGDARAIELGTPGLRCVFTACGAARPAPRALDRASCRAVSTVPIPTLG